MENTKNRLIIIVALSFIFFSVARVGWIIYSIMLELNVMGDLTTKAIFFAYLLLPAVFLTHLVYRSILLKMAQPRQ